MSFLPLLFTVALPALDPRHAKNITVFHVNEHSFGAVPVNMDTGDATGDLFFDLFEVLILPLKCQNRTHKHRFGPDPCANPEAVGPDLMVNKVTLEVDSRFSGYAACNVCDGGHDPFGGSCVEGTYVCDCKSGSPSSWPPKHSPCNATVGLENVYESFGSFLPAGCKRSVYQPNPSPADCYTVNTFSKLSAEDHGNWYSSLDKGFCGNSGSACTWRVVSVDKIVRRSCHTRVFGEAVQAHGDPACLAACGAQRANVSSPCWVDCFYKAALGPDAGLPGGKVAGLSLEALKAAWLKPFDTEGAGGCPPQAQYDGATRPAEPAVPWSAREAGNAAY